MQYKDIALKISKELEKVSDKKTKESSQRFFKEKLKLHGTSSKNTSNIAKLYWDKIKNYTKEDIFYICEELYKTGYLEDTFLVSSFVPRLKDKFTKDDINIFERWIDTYCNNWATCDSFCNHSVGELIEKYPDLISKVISWTKSSNRWMKRAAAVSLIIPAKNGKYLAESMKIADILLQDGDDMVQKGYGWLLKEASRNHQKEIFEYVLKNKKIMPRTSLRYAIELIPQSLRSQAMEK